MTHSATTAAHRAYRSMLLALAYPGRPQPGPETGQVTSATALIESTWEPTTRLWRDGRVIPLSWSTNVERVDAADLLLLELGRSRSLTKARRGTELEPELGATVVWIAPRGISTRVSLSGPGVDGTLVTQLPLDPTALGGRAQACAEPPTGIDLIIVSPDGSVLGLPRTTRLAVLG